ncbi:hypothetical protein L204_102468 [Cryptococcus depauperatus]|nr:prenylcysteine oxidase/farnesylcysteine lyase [Cryptococcus depauperatus CBS 7855]
MFLVTLTATPTRQRLTAISILLLVALVLASKFSPSQSRYLSSTVKLDQQYEVADAVNGQLKPKRVAIVGAGASGSSAAFFLRRAARVAEKRGKLPKGSLLQEIIVYDKDDHIGGRTTTVHPHGDQRTTPQELGASIFVEANQNLMKAVKTFNLTLTNPGIADSGIGIWDGQQFLFQSSDNEWWTTARVLWRYGPLSPYRTKRAVGQMIEKFKQIYNPVFLAQRGPVKNIEDFAESLGLGTELTSRTGQNWAKEVVGAGERWISEIMEGSTRVNYASNMDKIHAFGAAVSMATGGASQVEGGNWQIFRAMLDDARAKVYLGKKVKDIIPVKEDGERKFIIQTNDTDLAEEKVDHVFWAGPWNDGTGNGIGLSLREPLPFTPYVRLHVTYLATTRPHPSPSFFGLSEGSKLPSTILTSAHPPVDPESKRRLPPPRFQSITWHGRTHSASDEYAVKVFSLTRLSDRFLREMLGEDPTWVLRKEWDSYPQLLPNVNYAPVELTEGVEYLAGMERWVSTMETQTISGREAVARVVKQWWGLGLGECENGDSWDWTC